MFAIPDCFFNKNTPENRGILSRKNVCLFFPHLCKALAAINRAIFARLKGNFSVFTAGSTGRDEHLALRLSGILTGIAAIFAPLGLVYEALGSVKFLLAGGENKFSATFLADESLVFVHLIYLAFG